MAGPITIRPATMAAEDHELLVDFQDSQITWLASIGSSGQWGTQPIRERNPEAPNKARGWIEKSERGEPWGSGAWCCAVIAERDGVPVAGLVLDSTAPAYVGDVLPEQDDKDPFVYLAYLIANRRAEAGARGGAAAALLEFAKDEVRKTGVSRICLDCYSGNDRKLVQYYESQGFKQVKDFLAGPQKWPGCVLEMRL